MRFRWPLPDPVVASRSMADDPRASLGATLAELGARLRRGLLVELGLLAASTPLLALAAAAVLSAAGVPDRFAAAAALVLSAAGLAVVLGWGYRRWRAEASNPVAVARTVDRMAGGKSAFRLLDAAQLARDRGQYGESADLADDAVDRAVRAADATGLGAAVQLVSQRRVRRGGAAVAGLIALHGAIFSLDPDGWAKRARLFGGAEGVEGILSPKAPEPALGDFRIDYRFPEYSGRKPRSFVAPSGSVRALPGTEVAIETRASAPLSSAELVFEHGDEGEPQRIAADVDGRRIRARFLLSRAGRYRIELKTELGELRAERRGHELSLEEDEPPSVRLLEPTETPLEVNEKDKVPLVYEASDDFGLGEARIMWRVLGTAREGAVALESLDGRRRYEGKVRFDLAPLALQPGDRVAYSVEVFDNDTILGPKLGASPTQELRVYSQRAHHDRAMAEAMAGLDALVHLLGDTLEEPMSGQAAAARVEVGNQQSATATDVATKLEAGAAALESDPLARKNLSAAFRQAAKEVQARGGALNRAARATRDVDLEGPQDRLQSTSERQAVYLADLLDDQRMMDAEAIAKDIREQQEALREALEAYRDAPDDEKRRLMAQAIADIQNRIRELMSEIARLGTQIPQDFVNQDALADRSAGMEEVAERLEQGDLDGAMKALDRMLEQTDRMLSQLREGRAELKTREYSEITERAEQLWEQLEAVKDRQKDLARRTETIADEVRKRERERRGDDDGFVAAQLSRLEAAAKSLERARPDRHLPEADLFELAERRVLDGRDAVAGRDFGAAREVLEQAIERMRDLDRDARRRAEQAERFGDVFGLGDRARATQKAVTQAEPKVQEVLRALEALERDPSELLSDDERRQMQRFEQEQAALLEQTGQIEQGLEELGEQLPLVGPEVRSSVGEAKAAMGEAKGRLGGGDAPGAAGQERRAVEALDQLSQQLEEMGSQSGGGQGGAGVPLPFGQPSGTEEKDERGGQGRFNRDKVEIPRPEAYQAPSAFREEIIEAAKQGTAEGFRDAVRRYYEEIVR